MSSVYEDMKTVPARERQGALRAVLDLKKPKVVASRVCHTRRPPRPRQEDHPNLVAQEGLRFCRGKDLVHFVATLENIKMTPETFIYKVGDGINLVLDISDFEIKTRDEIVKTLHFVVTKVTIQDHDRVIEPETQLPPLSLSMTEHMYAPEELLNAIKEAYGVSN